MVQPEPRPPKKRLGQHFLVDPNTARIVARGVDENDVVLEVGPGRGALTTVLAGQARLVHAVELDPDALPSLQEALEPHRNVLVYEGDALDFDYGALDPRPNKLVANLPYNVASPLVLKLLEEADFLAELRFMVQLEVARRMAAERRTKDYGAYAVLVQLLAEVRLAHRVSPRVFDPPPRVWSAIVALERRRVDREDYERAKTLVLAAFKSRRKRLANNLSEVPREVTSFALRELGYGPDVRAEELRPEDFVALSRLLPGAV
ncbi:MAG: 16S rRNA (adenine(1518)-N(6)/adenine(1519)-N(6))-dimethyltransferase RsmA [Actinomycetota bacterium]|nr:16S rRNA (adenine(1518)-N(6)/adenine(1519)-N(6))-dimethyltransferase RsmA [Actinomycetota bacterium]